MKCDNCEIDADYMAKMLEEAAARGAKIALERIGLHDEKAGEDVRELRGLLDAWRGTKRGVWQTVVRTITQAILLAIAVGVAIKFKTGNIP